MKTLKSGPKPTFESLTILIDNTGYPENNLYTDYEARQKKKSGFRNPISFLNYVQ